MLADMNAAQNNRGQQTEGTNRKPGGEANSYSLSVSHCKSQLSVLSPSRCPSFQSCVDIRLVQKGSAQLIAGPLGVGGAVLRVEMLVCVCVCVRSLELELRDYVAYSAPSDMEVIGQVQLNVQHSVRNTAAVCVCVCVCIF